MDDNQSNESNEWDPVPIETIEDAAILISSYVIQGRIGPTNEDDAEVKSALELLNRLVREHEPE